MSMGSRSMMHLLLLLVSGNIIDKVSAAALGSHKGMPTLQKLEAKCGRSGMTVTVEFDQPFPGVIYSKGHYGDDRCHFVSEEKGNSAEYTFLIPIDRCGTRSQLANKNTEKDMFFENTIIIQLDPLITEVWDEARSLKCVWPTTLLRRVHSSPFEVSAPTRVSVTLDERSINTLMEIQQGRGPFQSPATGYVYMGDDTSVVIYLQDPSQSVDANVVNCSATSPSSTGRVQLIDDFGCLARPDLISPFDKTRETNGVKADLMLYSYLKAFRVGESPSFSIQCQLEICSGTCRPPCAGEGSVYVRRRRSATLEEASGTGESHQQSGKQNLNQQLKRVDLEQAVLVVEREEILADGNCSLGETVLVAGLVLLCIITVLSLLSCYLALKLSDKHKQNQRI